MKCTGPTTVRVQVIDFYISSSHWLCRLEIHQNGSVSNKRVYIWKYPWHVRRHKAVKQGLWKWTKQQEKIGEHVNQIIISFKPALHVVCITLLTNKGKYIDRITLEISSFSCLDETDTVQIPFIIDGNANLQRDFLLTFQDPWKKDMIFPTQLIVLSEINVGEQPVGCACARCIFMENHLEASPKCINITDQNISTQSDNLYSVTWSLTTPSSSSWLEHVLDLFGRIHRFWSNHLYLTPFEPNVVYYNHHVTMSIWCETQTNFCFFIDKLQESVNGIQILLPSSFSSLPALS